ncbi:sigma-54-dependent transcriptional regulator [Spartinivicinus poritis]|uniref:Sigma-54 dependent transcriptional regulator n=1 Tax=Spartinivicinus poritis TaxID=2994640 RepID=A0ABT5UF77_9GAMM|nr:sigma-54 dependent transcriptional regulator [Spartinivicinus sp. A2-2]MDE1465040.1 sigma-54 dependent transcriptional regulator [Spartinivicinus sp. A2-2]
MSQKESKILIVDSDEGVLASITRLLKGMFSHVKACSNPSQIPFLLEKTAYDVVLLDMSCSERKNVGLHGFYWLSYIKSVSQKTAVVMMTDNNEVDIAIQAFKNGAVDLIIKPWKVDKLQSVIGDAYRATQLVKNESLKAKSFFSSIANKRFDQKIIGQSQSLKKIVHTIHLAAPTDANILILGENGTGKGVIAREIHRYSHRNTAPFISVDLGAIPDSLFEAELFGYQKGAFTGAAQNRIGRIQEADGGTLFLDEIGNLPTHFQAKILNVIELREITPIGSNQAVPVNIRIVAATNLSKNLLFDQANFRQDLLYRINTVEIALPPLRERPEDIPLIIDHYLKTYTKKYHRPTLTISSETIQALQSFSWPGNIRELQHSIERAVILSESSQLSINDFPLLTENNMTSTLDTLNLNDIEKHTIEVALRKYTGNITHAARELGLSRAALYRRLDKYAL